MVLSFNPHLHAGGDKNGGASYSALLKVSTHTSTQEVTGDKTVTAGDITVSTHTSTQEVTAIVNTPFYVSRVSTHTSTQEVTRLKG